MNWHYESGGQSAGPIPEEELRRLLAAGTLTTKTLIWREGMAAWAPLGETLGAPSAPPPASGGADAGEPPQPGWIRCTATGKSFPPSEIVYIAGKPYSLEAKDSVVQGVVQTGAVPTDLGERTGPAWEDRETLGMWKAAIETTKAVLLSPGETFATMKREGGLGGPLLFMVIFGSIAGIVGIGYQIIIQKTMSSAMPQLQQAQAGNPFAGGLPVAAWIAVAIFMPALIALGSFITTGIAHLSLMICGGAKQPFETTYRTYCYAQGAAAPLQLIPVCGAYLAAIWGIVVLCIGIAKTHEIGTGRAVIAVLLPMLLCCGTIFIVAVAFGATAAIAAKGGMN